MPQLSIYTCGGGGNNSGEMDCEFKPENITGLIATPENKEYDSTEILTFDTVLKNDSIEANKSRRVYPILGFTNCDDKSSEGVTESLGYGGSNQVRDGKIAHDYRLDRGLCAWTKLRGFHKKHKNYRFLLVDSTNNVIWGWKNSDGNLQGFSLSKLAVPEFKTNDGSKAFHFFISAEYAELAEFENFAIVQFPKNKPVSKIATGLNDVTIEVTSAMNNSGVMKFKLKTACGAVSLGESFGDILDDAALWSLVIDASGTPITIASVAYSATGDEFTLTATLPNTTTFPVDGTATLSTVSIPDLVTAGVVGYEFTPVQQTRVA